LLRAFAAYYLATGLWPILHIRSFMAITGPKRDQWLVKAMGAVVAAVGAAVALSSLRERPPAESGWT
jgi:uncharacterized protein (DUF2236 family)